MYSWVDHKTMQTNNYNNKNKPNAASAELTGNNNKLTTQQFHQQQPRPQRAYIVKQHPTKSFWENHLSWNYKMLSQTIFKHRALQVLQKHTSQTKEILVQPTVFQTTGMIYAMVHLRTNRIYVIATKRKLSTSFKQHWYSAYLRNTKFHRSLAKGKLRDVMIWPLENANAGSTQNIKTRKKYWITTLLKRSTKKWVKKRKTIHAALTAKHLHHHQLQQETSQKSSVFLANHMPDKVPGQTQALLCTQTKNIDITESEICMEKIEQSNQKQPNQINKETSPTVLDQNSVQSANSHNSIHNLKHFNPVESENILRTPPHSYSFEDDICISPQNTSTKQAHNFLECKNDTSSTLIEDSTDEFQFTTGQSIDDSLDTALQDLTKFEGDLLKNLMKNHKFKVDQNKYDQLVAKWTDLVKTKFSSADQIKEEMDKCANHDIKKYYKLEEIWRDISYKEYLASLSPSQLQQENKEKTKRSQQTKHRSRRLTDIHKYGATDEHF